MRSSRLATSAVALAALAVVLGGCGGSTPSEPVLGFNDQWSTRLDQVGLSAAAGADTDRTNLVWSRVERRPGRYDWRGPDNVYRTMLAHGIRPLFVITSAPCWAHPALPRRCHDGGPVLYAPSPARIEDFARFAALAAHRYPRAQGLEIWNEPNLPRFWKPNPDAALFGRLLKAAADAIHATGSPVPVVSGGLAAVEHTGGGRIAYAPFLRRMAAAGGVEAVDAVGFHPYPPHQAPIDPTAAVDDVSALMRRVSAILAQLGDAGKPIWVTEVGVSTSGPARFTPDEQAAVLGRIYDELAAMPEVPVVVINSLFDGSFGPGNWQSGSGVVSTDGARKPSYCALAEAAGSGC